MKYLILLLLPLNLTAQSISLSYQPADHGLGVMMSSRKIYGSLTYGNWGAYKMAGISNHVKASTGILIPIFEDKYLTAGVSHHSMEIKNGRMIDLQIWSFELGVAVSIEKLKIGVRTDMLRWEPCIDVGISFGKK